MKIKKRIVLVLLGTAAVAALIVALRPAPVPANAIIAERDSFSEYVEEEGRTALRDPYTVSAPIAGHLRRVALEVGDGIEAGEVLFELEPGAVPALDARSLERARAEAGAAQSRLQTAEAELEARESEAEYADREYERNRILHKREAVSAAHLDLLRDRRNRARSALRAASNAVDTARFELRNARAVLEVTQGRRPAGRESVLAVRAPLGGKVLARHRRDEGVIQPGEVVMEIGDLSQLEVRVDVLSMDAVRIEEDMRVVLTRWGGEKDLNARVRRVEPAGFERVSALGVEEQRVPVWVSLDAPREEWGRLGTGYRVEARFILWEDEEVLQIPTSALFRREDEWAVFVVRDGRAVMRPVGIGRRSGLWTQVISGIESGEKVVTHPGARIEDGVRVRTEVRAY